MSKVSSITSMPRRSHAASIARLIGWCALRSALKPASFSFSTRRSSARAIVALPRTPLSWWMHAPRRSTGSPLMRSPRSASTAMVRMPNSVDASVELRHRRSHRRCGTCTAPAGRRSTAEAAPRTGVAAASRAGPGTSVSGATSRATTAPVSSTISVVTRGRRRDQRLVLHDGGDRDHRTVVVDRRAWSRARRRARCAPVRRRRDGRRGRSRRLSTSGSLVRGRRRPRSCSPRRSAGARRSTPRSSSTRRAGDRRACRSRTPRAPRYTPSNSTRIRLPRVGLGHDEGLLVLPHAAGEEAVVAVARRGSRRPPIIASWGRRTATHGWRAAADQLHEVRSPSGGPASRR